jgi:serine/threonine protein kinase
VSDTDNYQTKDLPFIRNVGVMEHIYADMLIINLKSLSYKSDFIIKEDHQNSGMQVDDGDLPVFNLSTIAKATNNFTIINKIGEGGFGPVYKVICL